MTSSTVLCFNTRLDKLKFHRVRMKANLAASSNPDILLMMQFELIMKLLNKESFKPD